MTIRLRTLYIAPTGAQFPKGLRAAVIPPQPFYEKLVQASADPIAVMTLTSRELTALRQFSDLFGIKLVVVQDIPAVEYNTIWLSDAAHLDRIPVDALAGQIDAILDRVRPEDDPTLPQMEEVTFTPPTTKEPATTVANPRNVTSHVGGRRQARQDDDEVV